MSCRPSQARRGLVARESNVLFDPEKQQQRVLVRSRKKRGIRVLFSSRPQFQKRSLQALAISAFLVSWVANGELLQGISNGSFGYKGYNKPIFLTWFSYNFMILSIFMVYPYLSNRKWTLRHYLCIVWAGKLGLKKAVMWCTLIGFALQVLNVLLILGLQCISVSLSNAVYQLQLIFALALSVWWLKDPFILAQALGIILSVLGVALVVLPPLLQSGEESGELPLIDSQSVSSCPFKVSPTFMGVLATLCSAAIGGAYLVSWRVLDQQRHDASSLSRMEGFVDTQMTLTVIGICNLLVGWPLCIMTQEQGVVGSPSWWLLVMNGLVEYIFDASCAIAIYMTSPVVVAIVSPLTIPLSLVVDSLLWRAESTNVNGGFLSWFGVALICFGVCLLEIKPTKLSQFLCRCWNCDKEASRDAEKVEIEHESEVLLL